MFRQTGFPMSHYTGRRNQCTICVEGHVENIAIAYLSLMNTTKGFPLTIAKEYGSMYDHITGEKVNEHFLFRFKSLPMRTRMIVSCCLYKGYNEDTGNFLTDIVYTGYPLQSRYSLTD